MIGVQAIASYTPSNVRDNFSQAEQFGKEEQFVRERIGAMQLPIKDSDVETSDLASNAIEHLLNQTGVPAGNIECLVVCTQNPDGCGLPHTSAIVQHKVGLSNRVAAFDISLGCSGYIYGLAVVKGFMQDAGLSKGILVTADPYSKILDFDDVNTSMLFGDAATATLLSTEPVYNIGQPLLGTDGSGASFLFNNDGRLYMNGRQIFNFAATRVPSQILALLEREEMNADDIDQFVFHQGSRYIVSTLAKRLKIPEVKAPVCLEKTGNTVSSSIPLILEQSIQDSELNRILLSGFGVGLSWGSTILTKI